VTAIGELRLRLTIEAPVERDDGEGGVIRDWEDAGDVWAALASLAMDERTAADLTAPLLKYRLVLRRYADLTATHRFRLGSRVLRIRAMRDPDERGEFIECLVEEERP
jgi:SPP1 family predicted phage head-tail adaptor